MKKILSLCTLLFSLVPLYASNSIQMREIDHKVEEESELSSVERCALLLQAAESGNADTVKSLFEGRIDINITDDNGNTPWHLASKNGHKCVVLCLCGKNIAKKLPNNNDGHNAKDLEVLNGQVDVFVAIIVKSLVPSVFHPFPKFADPTYFEIRFKDEMKSTLKKAIIANQSQVIRRFFERIKLHDSQFPFFLKFVMDQDKPDMLDAFNFKNINEKLSIFSCEDNEKLTSLLYASYVGYPEIVLCLIAHNANILLRTDYGKTALHLAVSEGHVSVCEALLKGIILQSMKEKDLFSWMHTLKDQGIIVKNEKKEIIKFVNDYCLKVLLRFISITSKAGKIAARSAKDGLGLCLKPNLKPIPLNRILDENYFHVYLPYLIEKWFKEDLEKLEEEFN